MRGMDPADRFATAVSLRVDHCLYAGLLLKEAEHKKSPGRILALGFFIVCG
jgi:hypothetical protein